MALNISLTNPTDGAMLAQAYARVSAVSIDVANERAGVTVLIYKDAAARQEDRLPIEARTYTWDAQGRPAWTDPFGVEFPQRPSFADSFESAAKSATNVFACAYSVLKSTEPDYHDSTDC